MAINAVRVFHIVRLVTVILFFDYLSAPGYFMLDIAGETFGEANLNLILDDGPGL